MSDNNEVLDKDNTDANESLPEESQEGTDILFPSPPSQWGDCEAQESVQESCQTNPPEESSDVSSDVSPQVPRVLTDLCNNGVTYDPAPKFTWSPKESTRFRLRKELSVVFSIDTQVTSQQIIEGFDRVGIDPDEILAVQRRASNNSWVVSFRTPDVKNMALGVPSLEIAGCTVFLGDSENRVQIVKIFEAPIEMPDTVLIGRLSHYGKVFSFRRDRATATIYNGVRTARMRLNLPIPPTIFVAGELVRIWYPTQPKMCRRCGDTKHVAANCSSFRCHNCEAPGHLANVCPRSKLCSICLGEDHTVISCPFYVYSANLVNQPGESFLGDAGEMMSQPAKSPSYAKAASRSPEQIEAIKAAGAARSTSDQSSKKSQPSTDSLSKSSAKKASEKSTKSDGRSKSPSARTSEKRSEQEREHSRERAAGRDRDRNRDRDRDRDRERDRDRDRPRDRDSSREDDRDRSGHRQHHRESVDSEDSDYVKVRYKRRSRR